MAIIHSFSYITSNFKELIDNEEDFKKFIEKLFSDKLYNFNTFYSILNLIRNISTHWSISKNYKLKEKDFKKWKNDHTKKWILELKLNININIIDSLHRLDLLVNINKIKVWYNFSNIFWSYKMLMFIELCMNVIFTYQEKNK